MRVIKLIFLGIILLASFSVQAERENEITAVEHKVVLLQGENSNLMDGDLYAQSWNKPRGYGRNKVLPALLSSGWRIKSIHVNERRTEGSLYGYALLEKELHR